jgi:hypothetical protein
LDYFNEYCTHTVDDVLLGRPSGRPLVERRANNVDLVILERNVALVHVNDVISVVHPETATSKKHKKT